MPVQMGKAITVDKKDDAQPVQRTAACSPGQLC